MRKIKNIFKKFFALIGSKRVVLSILFVSCWKLVFSQFTGGNIVVLQVGNGAMPLANTGNQIILKEFSQLGGLTFSVAISTSVNPLLIGGTAVSEGGLSLSPNGKYLVFAGYANNLTFTASLSGATAAIINRGIGIVDASGSYSRIATSAGFYSGNSIRSASSDGNENYWASGANAGANYFGNNSAAATVQNAITNTRNVSALNAGLYFSTGSGAAGIYKVGSGFPIISGQTCSLVIATASSGTSSPSPFAFFFNTNQTICYVADDRTFANGGGIQKWISNAGVWSFAYTLGTGTANGTRGVVVDFSGTTPKIYATTSEGSSNRLIAITDVGALSTATNMATATGNTIFRGLAFAPFCSAAQVISVSASATVCASQPFTLNANFSGTGPLTYSWSGPGNYSSSLQNPVLSNTLSGNYSFTVFNGCGIDIKSVAVSTNSVPVISVNSPSICAGGSVTLVADGALTYSWNNAVTGVSVLTSPTLSTNYTVTGTSQQGCSSIAVSTVTVLDSLNLWVNSESLCIGVTVTLTATGAVSYSWNSGTNTESLVVAPVITTEYTVSGFAPGCLSKIVISTVTAYPPPLVVIQSSNPVFCVDESSIELVGIPPEGIFYGNGVSGNIFNPLTAITGTFPIVYQFTDSNSCTNSDTALFSVELCTASKTFKQKAMIKLAPNPAKHDLQIGVDGFEKIKSITILNTRAQVIETLKDFENGAWMDVSACSPGIYFIVIETFNRQFVGKFIKE